MTGRVHLHLLGRAAKKARADGITDVAASIAYYTFVSIPAVLLVAVGIFSLFAGPNAIRTILRRLETVVPAEAIALLEDSLSRLTEQGGGGVALVGIGTAVALWTATGAMTALIRGLNVVYEVKEGRGFLRQRLVALVLLVSLVLAGVLAFGLLVMGPHASRWIGDAVGHESALRWIWWTAQWPILVLGLLLAFGAILYIGPNVGERRLSMLSAGSGVAVAVWLAVSGLFALYVANFGSYNKTWGSLAAVIVMLTWLWLSALAILFGGEVNAAARRSRGQDETPPGGEAETG